MDTATVFHVISIAAFSLSGLLLISAVFLFVKLNIPEIVGNLSGRTALKQIQIIRTQNAEKGEHRYRPDTADMFGRQSNERQGNSGRLKRRNPTGETVNTGNLNIGKAKTGRMRNERESNSIQRNVTSSSHISPQISPQKIRMQSADTDILYPINQYAPSASTEVLSTNCNNSIMPVTEKLNERGMTFPPGAGIYPFEVIKNIILIHTDEII